MEEIGEMIGKGFGIWRHNINLCIPFLLNFFVSMLVIVSFLVVVFLAVMPFLDLNSTSIQNRRMFRRCRILSLKWESRLAA